MTTAVSLDALQAQVELLKWAKARESEIAEVKANARAAIEDALGDNEVGTVNGEPVVTWKHYKRRSLAQKALKAALPEVAEQFMETTETRRFEVL
jgi:predicted phage-related endonuclease